MSTNHTGHDLRRISEAVSKNPLYVDQAFRLGVRFAVTEHDYAAWLVQQTETEDVGLLLFLFKAMAARWQARLEID